VLPEPDAGVHDERLHHLPGPDGLTL
jgi:hypothetical protein